MKDLITIQDLEKNDIYEMFADAKRIKIKNHNGNDLAPLLNQTVVTSFPPTSLRTRISFEIGLKQLGANVINVPINFNDKELLEDKVKYLNNWLDYLIIRESSQKNIEKLAKMAEFSVINAMSAKYHPCEVLSDLFTLYETIGNLNKLKFVFVGEGANISNSWFNAAAILDLNLTQICPPGYEVDDKLYNYAKDNSEGKTNIINDMEQGISGADIILTDGWPPGDNTNEKFKDYQINMDSIKFANEDCLVNPCPPFTRDQEISTEIINSDYFIGYETKKDLLHMQKSIIMNLESNKNPDID
jgi:ornithine carbamoyltransferase